jgi:hypothetical protein
MSREVFLILNLCLAFYNVGTIWAHEVDIFRSWKYLDSKTFQTVQRVHWYKLPYWVFIPAGLSFIGALILFWYRPQQIPIWEIGFVFCTQLLSHLLTALFWGQWQAKLSNDERGAASPYLAKILKTHGVSTFLISSYGLILLYIVLQFST